MKRGFEIAKLLGFFKSKFSSVDLSIQNIFCYSTIIFSSLLAVVGFISIVLGFYIGDHWVRTSLITLGLLFSFLIFF
ncbi:MAG: hypothetical protein V5A68_07830 [Candidatus Thermoplasmatota archaeon]